MRVTSLTASRLHEVSEVLGAAFADDPIVWQMIPRNARNRTAKVAGFFRWSLRYTGFGNVDVALSDDDGSVLGAAIWEPPTHRAHPIRASIELPRVWLGIGRRGSRAVHEYEIAVAPHHPTAPHWHLVDIGTDPSARGRGVGSALLEYRLATLDEQGALASLSATSPGSRRLYERYGFEALQEIHEGIAAGLTVMSRAPGKPGQPLQPRVDPMLSISGDDVAGTTGQTDH